MEFLSPEAPFSSLVASLTLFASHQIGGSRKRSYQSTNADQKSLKSVFLITNCRQLGDKWQSITLFLNIFDLHSSIVLVFLIVAYPLCACWAIFLTFIHVWWTFFFKINFLKKIVSNTLSECHMVWIQIRT